MTASVVGRVRPDIFLDFFFTQWTLDCHPRLLDSKAGCSSSQTEFSTPSRFGLARLGPDSGHPRKPSSLLESSNTIKIRARRVTFGSPVSQLGKSEFRGPKDVSKHAFARYSLRNYTHLLSLG